MNNRIRNLSQSIITFDWTLQYQFILVCSVLSVNYMCVKILTSSYHIQITFHLDQITCLSVYSCVHLFIQEMYAWNTYIARFFFITFSADPLARTDRSLFYVAYHRGRWNTANRKSVYNGGSVSAHSVPPDPAKYFMACSSVSRSPFFCNIHGSQPLSGHSLFSSYSFT